MSMNKLLVIIYSYSGKLESQQNDEAKCKMFRGEMKFKHHVHCILGRDQC